VKTGSTKVKIRTMAKVVKLNRESIKCPKYTFPLILFDAVSNNNSVATTGMRLINDFFTLTFIYIYI
jgi:hypothetical protein